MSLFCTSCNNLLSIVTTADSLIFKCQKCQTTREPTAADTLRFESIKGTNLMVYKTILQNAGQDPCNPKVEKTCKCRGNIARQVRLSEDMRLINICVTCNAQWLEGTEQT